MQMTMGMKRFFGGLSALIFALLAASPGAAWADEGQSKREGAEVAKVVVPRIQAKDLDDNNVQILTDILLDVLLNRHSIEAMGPMEIADLLSLEAQRQLVGCSATSCLSEIGGSLGARYLIAGSVGKLGSQLFLTLRLIDTELGKPAGRASIKIEKLEDAADALGPLTDKLLGRTFRAARSSEIAAFRKQDALAPIYDPMSSRDFLKAFNRYREILETGHYSADLIQQRETLLKDLLLTSSQPRYDEKYKQVAGAGWVGARTRGRVTAAKSLLEAEDARKRFYEWLAFARGVEDVAAAYAMGREKEKLGTGGLPTALPSKISAAKVPVADASPEVEAFLGDYDAAQAVLAVALKAKTVEEFSALFAPEDPKHSRSSPDYSFKSIQSSLKGGYQFDICPLYILSADAIEEKAKRYAKDKILPGCIRKMQKDSAYLNDPKLIRVGKAWKIERW